MEDSSLTPFSHSTSVEFVSGIGQLVSEFERLLANERYLLSTGKTEGMQAIADAKQYLVTELQVHEGRLVELFQTAGDDNEVVELKNRLIQCRTDNTSNHSLVMLELKHTTQSLDLLRSVLKMNDLSLYSSQGEVTINREQRRLGSA